MLTASNILDTLISSDPMRTFQAPRDARGIYGLVDHHGQLSYIGSTSSLSQSLYERIHQRHRTGSEHVSHYFSYVYNLGRMWRDRDDTLSVSDGKIAKELRNEFIKDHCRAVWVALPDHEDIAELEQAVLRIAPKKYIAWNGRQTSTYDEPTDLVNETLSHLKWAPSKLEAIERQKTLYVTKNARRVSPTQAAVEPQLPQGLFKFFALDVETANQDRSSICQIGIASVRSDKTIETWKTYIDPQTDKWTFTSVHGILPEDVKGAPTFAQIYPKLQEFLGTSTVYQHSSFDSSAFNAACTRDGLFPPKWHWQDSVKVARNAWPELTGYGGHGLANLKKYLGLVFDHHDAGEDARAAAQVVLRATATPKNIDKMDTYRTMPNTPSPTVLAYSSDSVEDQAARLLGKIQINGANLRNNHMYLTSIIHLFPDAIVGGANTGAAAPQAATIMWGNSNSVQTDIDATKRLFRKRGWQREFFEANDIRDGDYVAIYELAPFKYRVSRA